MDKKITYDITIKEDIKGIASIINIKEEDVEVMIKKTTESKNSSYSPYSKFRVGSCIYTTKGNFITGCNVENISYGITICAERSAICSAISQGFNKDDLYVITVTTDRDDFLSPCGACRQFISEFPSFTYVLLLTNNGKVKITTPEELLPFCFKTDL